jgi:hypothetical protein
MVVFSDTYRGDRANERRGGANGERNPIFQAISLALTCRMFVKQPG